MTDVKIKSGYARHKETTVDELIEILSLLSKQGYGDNKVAFGYDSNSCYTSADKFSEAFTLDGINYVNFDTDTTF